MYNVTFVIFGRQRDGTELELFRWCRDAASGIARAEAEAKRFGFDLEAIWAIPA